MAKIKPILFKKNSLAREILFWMTLAGLIPFFILAVPEYFFAEKALIDAEKESLHQALRVRAFMVDGWLHNVRKDLSFISHSNCVQGTCSHACLTPGPKSSCPFHESVLKSHPAYRSIQAYDEDLSLISRTGARQDCFKDLSPDQLRTFFSTDQTFHVAKENCFEDDRTIVTVGMKVDLPNARKRAYIIALLDLKEAIDSLDHEPFLDTGKFYIISRQGMYIYAPGSYAFLHQQQSILNSSQLATESKIFLEYEDSRRKTVFASFMPVPDTDWLLVKEVDKDVTSRWRFLLASLTAAACFATLVIVFALSFIISRRLSRPLSTLVNAANSVSLGKIDNWEKTPEFPLWEVDQVGKAFNDMQERIENSEKALVRSASMAAIGEFSAKVVHDIRTPLSTINITLQAFAKNDLGPRDMERLAIAQEQAARLMTMANGLLSYGKPLQLNREKFTLGQLFDKLIDTMSPDLAEKDLELRFTEGEIMEVLLEADQGLLLQALINLLTNAVQWSPQHGIIEIEIRLGSGANRELILCITDAGPGFSENSLNKVFQPFYSTREKGTGLGLANTRKIIDYHDGSISAVNQVDGGAQINITLPVLIRPEDA